LAPVFASVFVGFAKRARLYWMQSRRTIANITGILQETISGSKTIKAFATEDVNIAIFDTANKEDRDVNISAAKLNAFLQPITQFIVAIALVIVIYTGAALLRSGDLSAPFLLGYVLLAMNFLNPFNNIGNFYNHAQAAFAGGERILLILDQDIEVKEKENAIALPPIKGEVIYENVSFSYVDEIEVLSEINLHAKPLQRVAFVGFTGAGKSTMISLLSRFYDPTKGRILIDGHDIKDVTLESIRNQMGIVLQDTFLFSGTVMENIRYGKLEATDDEVIEASKNVGAHKFIMKLPNGYQTEVRERGQLLSVGQRQLISFARALLANPPILILDEATSSVDPYTELKIQEALEVLLQGRNSFIIAHRLSTILNSDLICVMEHGKIIQQGTHDGLIEQGGLYKHLYEMQFKKDESSTRSKDS
jgi:ABC-type multidrug transport system fused ATPase/permease subunit